MSKPCRIVVQPSSLIATITSHVLTNCPRSFSFFFFFLSFFSNSFNMQVAMVIRFKCKFKIYQRGLIANVFTELPALACFFACCCSA